MCMMGYDESSQQKKNVLLSLASVNDDCDYEKRRYIRDA